MVTKPIQSHLKFCSTPFFKIFGLNQSSFPTMTISKKTACFVKISFTLVNLHSFYNKAFPSKWESRFRFSQLLITIGASVSNNKAVKENLSDAQTVRHDPAILTFFFF